MSSPSPLKLMVIGVILMILGVALPLLMVVKVLTATLALSFLSYGASLVGMFLAFYGLFSYVKISRRK
jgi:hypothetical protein